VKEENEATKLLIKELKLKECDQISESLSKIRISGRTPNPLPTLRKHPTIRMGNTASSCGIPRMMFRRNDRCRIKTTINHSDSETD